MSGWHPGVEERIGFYVYLLIDPRTDRAFYVGKGTGSRCFGHIEEARNTTRDSVGDYPKLQAIREIEEAGHLVRIEILRHGLDEPTAFHVEAAAIDLLGVDDLHNRVVGQHATVLGRMSVADINAEYGATPVVIDPSHQAVLIRISRQYTPGMTGNEIYEATRKWWRIGERRHKATHVMAAHGGLVRAVYAIDQWIRPTAEEIAADPPMETRWGFVGHPDPAWESRYLFGDVTAYLSQGNQNPIRYINC